MTLSNTREPLAEATDEILLPDLPIVDCHHHLWIRPSERYLLDEFSSDLNSGHKIASTVYVECNAMYRQTGPKHLRAVGEAEFVTGVAAMSESGHFGPTKVCAAFLGAADLSHIETVDEVLEALDVASGNRLRGIRVAAAWDEDSTINPGGRSHAPKGLMLDQKFRAGFARLTARNLICDTWQYHPQLLETCDLADAFPDATIVVNHCGGLVGVGRYASPDTFNHWRGMVTQIARRPNVMMKLGGISRRRCGFGFEDRAVPATAAQMAETWTPYIETCIERFGPSRCMFESNFPPDRTAGTYRTIWNALKLTAMGYSDAEKADLFSNTAKRVYSIE